MKNNFVQKIIAALCLMGIGIMAWGADSDSTRRIGIFIGSNNGGKERTTLRYAVSDARAVSRVFAEMGGVRGADNILLIEPDIRELGRVIDRAQELVQNAKQTAKRTELVFYYSGHSDETGLLLGRERYSYQELRERINQIPSDMRIVILDSCASGAFTRAKGGIKTQPFLIDTSVSAEGYAFLTSSSATESSQESDRIESSYFTHNLVTGLRGAADTVGDGQVTLNEAYRFAYTETLAITETSLYGAQHPSYDMQISGSGDVVLTDVKETSASLLIEASLSGRFSIRDNADHLIAEITKTAGRPIELGLETGSYRITLQQGDTFYRAALFLAPDAQTSLSMRDFALVAASPATARGTTDDEEEFVSYEPVNLQLVGSSSKKVMNNLLFGLLTAEGYNIEGLGLASIGLSNNNVLGLEIAGVYTIVRNDMYGIQGAGLVNLVGGDMYGIQGAGLLNLVGGDMYSISAAGLLNIAGGDMYGIQGGWLFNINGGDAGGIQAAGLFNITKSLDGIQAAGLFNITGNSNWYDHNRPFNVIGDLFRWQVAGIFNVAGDDFYGIQAALVNVNGQNKKSGLSLQFGLVNVSANERDIPFGLVNIVKNGIMNSAIYYDTYNMFNVSFRSGSKYFYSLFSVASSQISLGNASFGNNDAGDLLVTRAGVGVEFSLGQLFLDVDVTSGNIFDLNGSQNIAERHTNNVQGRLTLGIRFFKHLSVFAGVSYDYFNRQHAQSPVPAPAWDSMLPDGWSNEQNIHRLGFFAGVQF